MGTPGRLAATAAALAVVGLTLVLGASAGATTSEAPPVCARAQNQWARVIVANTRAKNAFTRASSLQAQLIRNGRTQLAHRLDARLAYLRSLHTTLVARVAAIAARVAGRCAAHPPVLPGF